MELLQALRADVKLALAVACRSVARVPRHAFMTLEAVTENKLDSTTCSMVWTAHSAYPCWQCVELRTAISCQTPPAICTVQAAMSAACLTPQQITQTLVSPPSRHQQQLQLLAVANLVAGLQSTTPALRRLSGIFSHPLLNSHPQHQPSPH